MLLISVLPFVIVDQLECSILREIRADFIEVQERIDHGPTECEAPRVTRVRESKVACKFLLLPLDLNETQALVWVTGGFARICLLVIGPPLGSPPSCALYTGQSA